MRTLMRTGCLVATGIALASVLAVGQEQEPPTFSSGAELVVLHVTVRDQRGSLVSGLTERSFSVLEDGTRQSLNFFREQDTPVAVGLLIDSSGSMAQNRSRVVAALAAFAEASHPDDEFFALAFNERVTSVIPTENRLTSDPSVLRAALAAGVGASGRTALYDGLSAALDELGRGERERKVIVAISDGGDNASTSNFDDTLRKAHASNAVIYAIALVDPLVPDQNPKLLRRFADATGGRFFDPRSVERVDEALREISLDIRSGYTLAYVPSNTLRGDTVRRIQVEVVGLDNRRLVGRTRAGYVAAAEHHPELEVKQ